MKTIIAGSRSAKQEHVKEGIDSCPFTQQITEVFCGEARGADRLGRQWAYHQHIPVRSFPANWTEYGISAGIKRNIEMVDNAEALIAIWDGKSKGTHHVIEYARKKNLQVYVFKFEEGDGK